MRKFSLFLAVLAFSAVAGFGQTLITSSLRFDSTAARDGSLTNLVAGSNLQKVKEITWTASRHFYIDGSGNLQLQDSSTLAAALSSAIAPAWANVTGKPTTLSGYGITDAATSAQGALAATALQPGANGTNIVITNASTATMVVVGAGTSAANGTYTQSGTVMGKAYYVKSPYTIDWTSVSSQWRITDTTAGNVIRYYSTDNVETPDLVTTWILNQGTIPIPTVGRATTQLPTVMDTKAPLASPALTGIPTAPTAAADTATTQIATTAFAKSEADAAQAACQSAILFTTAPSTSTSTGTTGTIIYAGGYLYVCIATDTWLRFQGLNW